MTRLFSHPISSSAKTITKTTSLCFAAIITFSLSPAFADTGTGIGGMPAYPDPQNPRSQSIFVETLSPTTSKTDAVKVVNDTDSSQTVLLYPTDGAVASGGSFTCAQASDPLRNAGSWIHMSSNEITLAAHGSSVVPFTITVPSQTEAGEQDACIVLQEKKAPTNNGSINLTFRTGIRVAILVPGHIVKQLTPVSLSMSQTSTTITISPTVINNGTVSVDANVTTFLHSLLGDGSLSQKQTFPALRNQQMTWNIAFNKPFWGGFYKIGYSLSYDTSNHFLDSNATHLKTVSGESRIVFVSPRPLALLIELTLLLLIVATIVYAFITYRQRKLIASTWRNYHIKPHDSLVHIAEAHHIPWKRLARINHIKPPYLLHERESIKVPPVLHRHGPSSR